MYKFTVIFHKKILNLILHNSEEPKQLTSLNLWKI